MVDNDFQLIFHSSVISWLFLSIYFTQGTIESLLEGLFAEFSTARGFFELEFRFLFAKKLKQMNFLIVKKKRMSRYIYFFLSRLVFKIDAKKKKKIDA